MEQKQESLFSLEEFHLAMKEWQGMPEFIQERIEPFSQITVRFETKADLEEFGRLIGQVLTHKTKSIWHPKLRRGKDAPLRWSDES